MRQRYKSVISVLRTRHLSLIKVFNPHQNFVLLNPTIDKTLSIILRPTMQMKILYKILGLAVIDFGLIWLWVYQIDPDPSISIEIIL